MVRSSGLQEKAILAVMDHVVGESLGRHPVPAMQLLPPSTYAKIVDRQPVLC